MTLRWSLPERAKVELQQGAEGEFSHPFTRYRGGDPGTVISGLAEGRHYFRLRRADGPEPGPWSPALAVEVAFFPRGQLFLLLALGGAVVAATAGAILSGYLRHRGGKEAQA